jgi:hypothetical protein
MSAVISRSGSNSELNLNYTNPSPSAPEALRNSSKVYSIATIGAEALSVGKKVKDSGKELSVEQLRNLNGQFISKMKVLKNEVLLLKKEKDTLKAANAEVRQEIDELKEANENLRREDTFTQGYWQAEKLAKDAQKLQLDTKDIVDSVKQQIFKKEPSAEIPCYINHDKVYESSLATFRSLDSKNQENRDVRKEAFDSRNRFADNTNIAEVSLRQCDNYNALYANFSEIRPVRKFWEAAFILKAQVENITRPSYIAEFREKIQVDSALSDAKKEIYIVDEYAKHIKEEYTRLQAELKTTKGLLDALNVAGDDPHNPTQTRIVKIFDELNKRVKEYSDNPFTDKHFEFYREIVKTDTAKNVGKNNEEICKEYTDARKVTSEWWNSSLNTLREIEVTIDLFGENIKVIQPLSQAYDEVDAIKRELKKKGKINKEEFKLIGDKFINVCNKYFSDIQNYYKFDDQYTKMVKKVEESLKDKEAKGIIDSYAMHVDAPQKQVIEDISNTYGKIYTKIEGQQKSLTSIWGSLNVRLGDTVNDLDYALTSLQNAWGLGYYLGQGSFRKTYNELISEAQKRKNTAQESEPNPVFKLGIEL